MLLALNPNHPDAGVIGLDEITRAFRARIVDDDDFRGRLRDHAGKALLQMVEPAFAGRDDAERPRQSETR
jgi:hypothetical protein